jgi:copper(I)-binding protein
VTRTPRIRSTAAVAGAVIGAVVLAGCSAGQVTQTSRQVTAVDGANANAGPIAVRDALFVLPEHVQTGVAYPRGSSAPLELVIVNTGGAADELVSVTSPIAGNGVVSGKRDVPGGQKLVVEGAPVTEVTPAAPTPGATPSASASRSTSTATPTAAPTTAAPTTAAPTTAAPTAASTAASTPSAEALPADAAGTAQIVLTGLRDDIRSGLTYEVVLTFRNAGPVRLAVPVAASEVERKDQTEAEH